MQALDYRHYFYDGQKKTKASRPIGVRFNVSPLMSALFAVTLTELLQKLSQHLHKLNYGRPRVYGLPLLHFHRTDNFFFGYVASTKAAYSGYIAVAPSIRGRGSCNCNEPWTSQPYFVLQRVHRQRHQFRHRPLVYSFYNDIGWEQSKH